VRKGDPTIIEGLGKKYIIKKQMLFEGYFKDGSLCGHGRMIQF
jgi:hypothetical protein